MLNITHVMTVQFEQDKSREVIPIKSPIPLKDRRIILLGGCEPEDLNNVVALAPVKYAEKCSEIEPPLPDYLPVYSYEWGRSKITIHRIYHNQPITIHLLTDADFARWTVSIANNLTNHIGETQNA